ncbi:hypothetical protein [Oryza sativa Japonica Group]|uniref:Uncharacterized protein n=1 Tax=Oryza sativa subsp. japonica TaxID=39947 RepID=Q9LHV4_ORYSJ|nr:hypothetical protein [Oryza sativa Japonica Group]BAB16476.1 hypothetical protein [Oryza sativa Japonica Group]
MSIHESGRAYGIPPIKLRFVIVVFKIICSPKVELCFAKIRSQYTTTTSVCGENLVKQVTFASSVPSHVPWSSSNMDFVVAFASSVPNNGDNAGLCIISAQHYSVVVLSWISSLTENEIGFLLRTRR